MSLQVQAAGRRPQLSLGGQSPSTAKQQKSQQAEPVDVKEKDNKPSKSEKEKDNKPSKSDKTDKTEKKSETTPKSNKTQTPSEVSAKDVKSQESKKQDSNPAEVKSSAKDGQEKKAEEKSEKKSQNGVETNGVKKTDEHQNGSEKNEKGTVTPTKRQPKNKDDKEVTPVKIDDKKSKKESKKDKKKEETTPQKSDIPNATEDNEVDMEPLAFEPEIPQSVISSTPAAKVRKPPASVATPSAAESKPLETPEKSEPVFSDRPSYPPSLRSISGRRSLRPMKDYAFSSGGIRESYRRINTELDVTGNTSMNVTVGSEVPNNWSFSLFGRSRKRERTPPPTENAESHELRSDLEASPKSPKRARLDFGGFFGLISSPVSVIRNRLARTTLQCSTPNKAKAQDGDNEDGVVDVENVSDIAIDPVEADNLEGDVAPLAEPVEGDELKKDAEKAIEASDIEIADCSAAELNKPDVQKKKACVVM